ncbi:universal stress protein [Natrarchaeobius sp. A-rgal3]|uniref:universal stress protein n=1 Tax=Natrarchaeobius versutus TaxID=1679078 RepID=UPI0035100AE1
MYEVLVPVDENEERVRSQVEWVTSLPNASASVHATLLFVFERKDQSTVPNEIRSEFSARDVVSSVRRGYRYLQLRDVSVDVVERQFSVTDTILQEATERAVDCVVLGGRTKPPTESHVFGSVTQEVLLRSSVPVVVTGTGMYRSH